MLRGREKLNMNKKNRTRIHEDYDHEPGEKKEITDKINQTTNQVF